MTTRSVTARALSAAVRWMGTRFHLYGDNTSDSRQIAYGEGWAAGYRQATKDARGQIDPIFRPKDSV